MVEIFKTNIDNAEIAERIKEIILQQFPYCNVNFDLDDCDKILRVDANTLPKQIIDILQKHNYTCEVLEC